MSWTEIQLGDAIHIKHGFAFKGEHFVDEGELIVLTPGNFHEKGGFRVRPGKDRAYAGDVPDEYILKEGDLIVAMTEQGAGLLGSSALVPESNRYLHNQRLGLVDRIDEKLLDREFLYYLFNTANVRAQISGSATGTKVRHTAPERIYHVRARVPGVQTQKAIARAARNYDLQISNNRRRIELLEQSARLLFKEWFVNLRYPGHEHTEAVDGLPRGWSRCSVESVCGDFLDGDWLETKDQGGNSYRILQISNIGQNSFVETGNSRYITEETFRRLNCTEVSPGDILISRMPEPIGRAWLVTRQQWRMVTAVDVTIARPDPDKVAPLYFLHYLNSPVHLARCAAGASGATRPRIAKRVMGALQMTIPPRPLQEEFATFAAANNELKERLTRQCESLVKARELLLPRLMDGRISV